MIKKRKILESLIIISSILFISCKASYQDIFDDINERFNVVTSSLNNLSLNDSDFKQEDMIPSFLYNVSSGNYLYLQAPDDAKSYEWSVEVYDDNGQIIKNKKIISTNQYLEYELPGEMMLDCRNELKLVVKTPDNKEFSDVAKIFIYND